MTRERPVPAIIHADLQSEPMRNGSTYQTLVGDKAGTTPVFIGIQTAPPGYRTQLHSHPYMEIVTVLEGEGEAWLEDTGGVVALRPGMSLVMPAGMKHWFSATGDRPLRIIGVHASPQRTVEVHGE
jgi:quercetin dioxygenase-like cupin family protein